MNPNDKCKTGTQGIEKRTHCGNKNVWLRRFSNIQIGGEGKVTCGIWVLGLLGHDCAIYANGKSSGSYHQMNKIMTLFSAIIK